MTGIFQASRPAATPSVLLALLVGVLVGARSGQEYRAAIERVLH